MADKRYAESGVVLAENVSRQGMPEEVPRTWILTTRDRALSGKLQRKGIEALGGVQTLIPIELCTSAPTTRGRPGRWTPPSSRK